MLNKGPSPFCADTIQPPPLAEWPFNCPHADALTLALLTAASVLTQLRSKRQRRRAHKSRRRLFGTPRIYANKELAQSHVAVVVFRLSAGSAVLRSGARRFCLVSAELLQQ